MAAVQISRKSVQSVSKRSLFEWIATAESHYMNQKANNQLEMLYGMV